MKCNVNFQNYAKQSNQIILGQYLYISLLLIIQNLFYLFVSWEDLNLYFLIALTHANF